MHSLKMMPSQELLLKPQLPFKAVLPLTKSRMRPRDALKSTSLTKTKRDSLTFPTRKSMPSSVRLRRDSAARKKVVTKRRRAVTARRRVATMATRAKAKTSQLNKPSDKTMLQRLLLMQLLLRLMEPLTRKSEMRPSSALMLTSLTRTRKHSLA